tara:strand:- start:48 stop:422 length:375 start_codon:yes stop_codon:yes gene_type:complete
MNYEAIVEGYTDDLKLIDAIDMLSRDPFAAGEILDYVASQTNNEKNVVTLPQMNPTEPTFSQDIQLLSLDWEPQYKSQGDLISISSNDTDEGQMLELSCQEPDTYPVPYDVDLSSDLHLNTISD